MGIVETRKETVNVELKKMYVCDICGEKWSEDLAHNVRTCIICGKMVCRRSRCSSEYQLDTTEWGDRVYVTLCKPHATKENLAALEEHAELVKAFKKKMEEQQENGLNAMLEELKKKLGADHFRKVTEEG